MKYEKYIKDGFFAWTLTSNGYKYMTWNLWLHWKRSSCSAPLCIVCADKPSYQFLQREGVPCVLMDDALADFGPLIILFGTRQFSNLNRTKLKLLDLFAKDSKIQQCLYLDGDIVVYRDIVLELRGRIGFWAQCDEQHEPCSETCTKTCPNFCTGLLFWTYGSDKGVFSINQHDVWKQKPEDQVWVNYAVDRDKVQVNTLSRLEYPNGVLATKTRTDPLRKEEAICLHYNYRVGDSKKADMKRLGDWLLPY